MKNLRQDHNSLMKSLIITSFVFCLTITANLSAQTLPEYRSTDNTGMGRQERFEAIEKYLTQMSQATRQMQTKLADDSEIQKQLKLMQTNIDRTTKELTSIKTEMSTLRTQWEQYKTANQGVSAAEWREYQAFLKPLKEGEYAKLQQEVEALKLVIRSMEEVIKDQIEKKP